jgi:cytosine/adenosine deaminase-related metal-dependent hydrolase
MLLTADRIHDGYQFLPKGSIIEVAEDGTITATWDRVDGGDEVSYYQGILCPGLVNAHCHLELSHMKGVIPKGTGLVPFLQTVMKHRGDFTTEQTRAARQKAYNEMLQNGIVAVGDIANTTDTLDLRQLDRMHIHSFIESLGFTHTHAQQRFDYSRNVYEAFAAQERIDKLLRQSIVPHAPYSVSHALFELIDSFEPDALLSIHNQECGAEDEYYNTKQGGMRQLFATLNINDDFFKASGASSVQTYGEWIAPSHPLLLVHNTLTRQEDAAYIRSRFPSAAFCLCPNANLYIEGCLPNVPMLAASGITICVGTDSLASNDQLSVLSELQTLDKHFPELGWEVLLRWATSGGAKALLMDNVIGSFERGKKPGVVQVWQDRAKRVL